MLSLKVLEPGVEKQVEIPGVTKVCFEAEVAGTGQFAGSESVSDPVKVPVEIPEASSSTSIALSETVTDGACGEVHEDKVDSERASSTVRVQVDESTIQDTEDEKTDMSYEVGQVVQTEVKRKMFVGKITRVSKKYKEYKIDFMVKRRGKYVFPKVKKEMWIFPHQIKSTLDL